MFLMTTSKNLTTKIELLTYVTPKQMFVTRSTNQYQYDNGKIKNKRDSITQCYTNSTYTTIDPITNNYNLTSLEPIRLLDIHIAT